MQKIPITIVSRCQKYNLNRVTLTALCKHLEKIAELEKEVFDLKTIYC